MNTPFTREAFLEVFAQYNRSVYPAQIALNLLALATIFLLVWKRTGSNKMITGILAFLWVWAGIFYHWLFFSGINKGAYVFGGLFVLQGVLFFISGMKEKLSFDLQKDTIGMIGWFFMIYALLIYPLLGIVFGHTYPAKPTFGLPCPLVIFTFGLLLQTKKQVPTYLLIIPGLWSLIGFSAVLLFGIFEDTMLLFSAVIGSVLLYRRSKRFRQLKSTFPI